MVFENPSNLGWANPGLGGKIRPGGNRLSDLLQDLRRCAHTKTIGHGKQIASAPMVNYLYEIKRYKLKPWRIMR